MVRMARGTFGSQPRNERARGDTEQEAECDVELWGFHLPDPLTDEPTLADVQELQLQPFQQPENIPTIGV
jgi:hypothetical protein